MQVEVTTGARLHFGLFALANESGPSFGGVGAMIDAPPLVVRAMLAQEWSVTGALAARAEKTSRQIEIRCQQLGHLALPGVRLEILSAPREHIGLGVGTQLSLAITAALLKLRGVKIESAEQLATLAGRGARSAVGTYGFLHGGMIVEAGKTLEQTLSPLAAHCDLPSHWRFVLLLPTQAAGLSGDAELRAFAKLPPVPETTSARLRQIALDELVPAAQVANFNAFCESLYHFNHAAGLCFRSQQHGAYANELTSSLIEQLRSWGLRGVGQSSWGPAIFIVQPSVEEAESLQRRLQSNEQFADFDVVVAAPQNRGANIFA